MVRWSRRCLIFGVALLWGGVTSAQEANSYPDGHGGEVHFPLGDLSFADEVVSFVLGEPKPKNEGDRIPSETPGIPDFDASAADNYTTLGCAGTLVVRFTDNALIDIEGPDLYIFEIGPAVEPTLLAISRDGEEWIEVGKIAGGRADVDIAPYVDGSEPYPYVRLTDGQSNCGGDWPGADIDAVGAIGSGFKIALDSAVLFDFGKSELREEAETELRRVLDGLAEYPGAKVIVEGHTDHVGSETSNQQLSERRAEAVRTFLVSSGALEPGDITSRGYGEKQPLATNETDQGRQKNRRVEITVIPAS